jgi:hypothetical protein
VVVIALLSAFAALRLRVLDFPLERDEGEYAYAGQLLRQGVPPYVLTYNMKWPGTYAAYAVLMTVFGETIRGIRVSVLLVTSLAAAGVFLLAARHFGYVAGLGALGAQLMLSASVASLGLFGHATHFVVLFAIAGFLVLTWTPGRSFTAHQLLLAGGLFALAALMKQQGAAFGLCALIFVADPSSQRAWSRCCRDLALLALGAAIPLAACAAAFVHTGVFERFWFWTVDYSRYYASQVPLEIGLRQLAGTLSAILLATPALWLIVFSGIVLLFWDREVRRSWKLTAAVLCGGVLATIPGLHFRPHYFLTLFPGAALLAGIAVTSSSRLLSTLPLPAVARFAPHALFAVVLAGGGIQEWNELATDATALSRRIYHANPFVESVEVARYIRRHTDSSDVIAVVGSEPEIYFYASRRSATGHIYTYALMEAQPFASDMQREMIAEISQSKPKFVVLVNVRTSWLYQRHSDRTILDWAGTLVEEQYTIDGVAEIFRHRSRYVWGPGAANHRVEANNYLVILKRRA